MLGLYCFKQKKIIANFLYRKPSMIFLINTKISHFALNGKNLLYRA